MAEEIVVENKIKVFYNHIFCIKLYPTHFEFEKTEHAHTQPQTHTHTHIHIHTHTTSILYHYLLILNKIK